MNTESTSKESRYDCLSVVVTVLNERDNIRRVVEDLLNQELKPDEIIVVDGESSDGTREILEDYAKRGNISLIVEKCNISKGRNIGIAAVRNEIVAITDAGCEIVPGWTRAMLDCFNGPEKPQVVAGNFELIWRNDFEEGIARAAFSSKRWTTEACKYFPSSRSLGLLKRAWKEAKGYPEWLYAAEDTLLNIRLRILGFRFVFCKDAVVRWRPRPTWSDFFRQRYRFALGNARVGIDSYGYKLHILYHGMILIPLLLMPLWPPIGLLSPVATVWYVKRNLWPQAQEARRLSGKPSMLWRVLAAMEVQRIAGIFGFLMGRWEHLTDPSFVRHQREWMGVDSLDDLPPLPIRPLTETCANDENRTT